MSNDFFYAKVLLCLFCRNAEHPVFIFFSFSDNLVQRFFQFLLLHRFYQVVAHSEADGFFCIFELIIPGYNNDLDRGFLLKQILRQMQPVHLRHLYIR